MGELKLGGVKKVAGQEKGSAAFAGDFAGSAVEGVADDGMSERRQVYANLVGAASVDFDVEQGEFAVIGVDAALNGVVGDGFAASGAASGHADAADGVATDGGGDGAFVVFQMTVDECDVSLLDFAGGELRGQLAMGGVVLGDNDEAAGFFVETVYDAGTKFAADLGEGAEAVKKGID
jgi:hypothetical protein